MIHKAVKIQSLKISRDAGARRVPDLRRIILLSYSIRRAA